MTVPLPNHSHCDYCGDPIPFGEKYCDENCQQLAKAYEQAEKKKDFAFYGMIVVSLVAILGIGAALKFLF